MRNDIADAIMYYGLNSLVIISVIALGLFSFNQFLDFKYKAELLMQPCVLCVELNPEWEVCYNNINNIQTIEQPIIIGNLTGLQAP